MQSAMETKTRRQSARPLPLIREAIGSPELVRAKLRRVISTVSMLFDRPEIHRRLERLRAAGYVDEVPTSIQLAVGGLDMVRYVIEPGARDYYATRGIHFGFHQLLRILDDPSSMIDPVGLLSSRDTIIGHVMQVVHLNPVYDLQLLEMFEDGLEQMEQQTAQMVAGTHPRQESIGAIVEDPEYHRRLLEYVQAFRRDRSTPHLVRPDGGIRADERFRAAERQFATLPGFLRYAHRLPRSVQGAALHLLTRRFIDPRLCDAG